MPVEYSEASLEDLQRSQGIRPFQRPDERIRSAAECSPPRTRQDGQSLAEFLHRESAPQAQAAIAEIVHTIRMLERHPYLGRALRGGVRELVISFGKRGYVASYRVTEAAVQVLRVRHQREAGVRL